jgi:hypothetical protein
MGVNEKSGQIFLVSLAILVAGCAATQTVSDPNRKQVSSVTISGSVAKPPSMFYLGPGGASGLMFGAIGGALAAQSIEDSRKTFQEHVDKNGISIEKIVLEEVSTAIRQSGKFRLADSPQNGGAVISVSIFQYGFSIPNGFSSRLVPIVGVRCEMKDASGRVLWSSQERTHPLGNPVEPIDPEVIRNDPKVLESSWRAAAKYVAAAIVNGF